MNLTDDHIAYIVKDLHYRGIVAEELDGELVDHIATAVEEKMARGTKFINAYHDVLRTFGYTAGLRKVQEQTLLHANPKNIFMLTNYLKIAFRQLQRQSFYAVINIAGLAVGMAACLMIALFIFNELSYDSYNPNADRLYRINNEISFGGNAVKISLSAAPVASAMQSEFPEVESTVRLRYVGPYLVKTADGNENIRERNVAWADSTFFKVFSVSVIEGNPAKALTEPEAVAISRSMAKKYFPGRSAIGGTMILDNVKRAHVTAVYEDIPQQSHFHFDVLISLAGTWPYATASRSTSFVGENWSTYLLLQPGADRAGLEAKFPHLLKKYFEPSVAELLGKDFTIEKMKEKGDKYIISLIPVRDIHLHSSLVGEFEPNGNIDYVYIFVLIGLFILGIASINFMNLSTARSGGRAKEVGIRKVMGSLRTHLVRQFLTESILIAMIASFLAIGLTYLALPVFNQMTNISLELPFSDSRFYMTMIFLTLAIGTAAGVYPAFFLSAFKPVNVLKGKFSLGMKSGSVRGALVVFQFVITIILIVGAIAVNQQLNFIQNKNLGFNKDQVIIIKDAYALRPRANVKAFKDDVMQLTSIESGTICSYLPVDTGDTGRSTSVWWNDEKEQSPENLVSAQTWNADYDYIRTFGMEIKAGRDFSPAYSTDSSAVVVNETAVTRLGLGPDPVGKKVITLSDAGNSSETKTFTVIGVVRDFHFSSMKEGIKPLVFAFGEPGSWNDNAISFRFRGNETHDVIAAIQSIWKKHAPGQPFLYSFLDEDFGKMYESEQQLGSMLLMFAALAIMIACLGLFALTAFTTEQRTREIGIRKVLGASVGSIIVLLTREFGKLILIAFTLSVPVAIYGVNWWLRGYSFRTNVGPVVYIVAGVAVLVISLATMSYQSFKAASSDPVKSLKSEN